MTYTEEVMKIQGGHEIVKNAMLTIGLTATDENVEKVFEMDLADRKQLWDAIFAKMQIGIKSFDQYLEEAKYFSNCTPAVVEAMKVMHGVLNFDAEQWLEDVCNIVPEVSDA